MKNANNLTKRVLQKNLNSIRGDKRRGYATIPKKVRYLQYLDTEFRVGNFTGCLKKFQSQ